LLRQIEKTIDGKFASLMNVFNRTNFEGSENEAPESSKTATYLMENVLNESCSTKGKSSSSTNQSFDNSFNETVIKCHAPRRSVRISIYKNLKQVVQAKETKKDKHEVANSKASRKISKRDHRKSILDILNKGSLKELQLLPLIGKKKAYEISNFRNFNGKFKAVDDLKNLSAMNGKLWQNFLKANMLL
jgi:DNA uptake protein ComE-like DNA-binding protein